MTSKPLRIGLIDIMKNRRKILFAKFVPLFCLVFSLTGCSKQPTWQIIGESLRSYVTCADVEPDSEGNPSYGYGPCVKLTNVTYDRAMGDSYCFNTSPVIGGFSGESYSDIYDWNTLPDKYYCVTWSGRYVDSDPNEPSDWRITFTGSQPFDLLP